VFLQGEKVAYTEK